MWKRISCGILAIVGTCLLLPRAGGNKNFVPDWTFKGSSFGSFRMLGGHPRLPPSARGRHQPIPVTQGRSACRGPLMTAALSVPTQERLR